MGHNKELKLGHHTRVIEQLVYRVPPVSFGASTGLRGIRFMLQGARVWDEGLTGYRAFQGFMRFRVQEPSEVQEPAGLRVGELC